MVAGATAALEREVLRHLNELLPAGWAVEHRHRNGRSDAQFVLDAPDGQKVTLLVEVKMTFGPRDVPRVVSRFESVQARIQGAVEFLVAAPFISERTRAALLEAGVGFLDMTGNTLIISKTPAIYIRSTGASRDPSPSDDKLKSLAGRGAAQAVRALIEFRPPFGIRELAERSGVALGTLSRTVDLLDREGLLERSPRGPIDQVDFVGVIRRWASDYSVSRSNQVVSVLATRGLPALVEHLSKLDDGYAATGALAASKFAEIAPTRLASLYVRDAREFADRVGLRTVDDGANVWLIEPASDVVFERVMRRGNIICANPAQLCADLLTGPGRDPSLGEEMLSWMGSNDEWRS